jgi:hypothetical protein
MLTKTVQTPDGEKAIQASRREDGGWQIREPDSTVWTDFTDKKHSRDLISLYIDLIYEGGSDPEVFDL